MPRHPVHGGQPPRSHWPAPWKSPGRRALNFHDTTRGLDCGHTFTTEMTPPNTGDVVWCRRCDKATRVLPSR